MLWLVRILIQNGLCLPATWLTIATCINTTDVIIYQDSFGITPPMMRGELLNFFKFTFRIDKLRNNLVLTYYVFKKSFMLKQQTPIQVMINEKVKGTMMGPHQISELVSCF